MARSRELPLGLAMLGEGAEGPPLPAECKHSIVPSTSQGSKEWRKEGGSLELALLLPWLPYLARTVLTLGNTGISLSKFSVVQN